MMTRKSLTQLLRGDRRGAVALMFALMLVPIILVVALAVDYGFYIQARAQLNLAADAASLYATRIASQALSNGYSTVNSEIAAGQTAGQQMFAAQMGTLKSAVVSSPTVTVTHTTAPVGFTSSVSYTATMPTHFGSLIPASLPVGGAASSVVQASYVEVLMLVDNSSSMLIGATAADITALEQATPCSTQSATAGQGMGNYSWDFTGNYGYNTGNKVPPYSPVNGYCDSSFDGPASECFYVPQNVSHLNNLLGRCTNGGGVGLVPQAPCAFACHSDPNNNDYYGLARSITPAITLRLDVVHNAAYNVIQTLNSSQQMVNQFSVGYYEFSNDVSNVYPGSGNGEASTNMSAAMTAVQNLNPQVTADNPNTDFTTSMNDLANQVTPSGNGLSPTTPVKNLFIVTDGLQDSYATGPRVIGPMTNPSNETLCQQFKNMGFTIYVLYTPYFPIPNPFYASYVKPASEPLGSSSLESGLQACASNSSTYFEASDSTSVNNAMQTMLKAALNSPGRVAN